MTELYHNDYSDPAYQEHINMLWEQCKKGELTHPKTGKIITNPDNVLIPYSYEDINAPLETDKCITLTEAKKQLEAALNKDFSPQDQHQIIVHLDPIPYQDEEKPDIFKKEDEVDKLMLKKGIDREEAWKLLQAYKESDYVKKRWAEQDKEKASTPLSSEIEKAIWFYYDTCGFSIIPLGANPNFKDDTDYLKKPSLNTWEKYHDERATKEEIQQWLTDGLFTNIGVICGHVSNDLVIIDIDDERIPEICKLNWKSIISSGSWPGRTGKGYQIWCRHHANPGGIRKPKGYSLEFRANNGYCVAPPSIHPNGNNYRFIEVDNLESLPALEKKDVMMIFKSMKTKIAKAWNITVKEYKSKWVERPEDVTGFPKCVDIALQRKVKHPDRYYTLYGITSACFFRGMTQEETQKIATDFNNNMCEPPHTQKIVNQAVEGAYKEDAHRYGCEFWQDDQQICPHENVMECPQGKKHEKRKQTKKYKIFSYKEKEIKGKTIFVKEGVISPNLANLIMGENDYHFFTMRDTLEMFYYKDGMYHTSGETIITSIAEDYMESLSTSHRKNEVVSHIQDYNYKDREQITAPINLINLRNGLLDINTFKMIQHTPEYFFVNQHPVKYNPDASYKAFEDFLKQISMKEGVVRQKIVDTIQEYMGYSFFRGYPLKNYIVLDGGGDNGKTVLMNVELALIGEQNNTSIGLQELNERPFAKAQLYGKNTNISDDLPKKALKLTGIIKAITGNSPIWADVKNSKKGISFTPYAKPWYACNELPETNDYSDAFFSRQLQVTLLNKYLQAGDPKIDNITCFERNVHLTEQLTTEENLSGILNFALIGLKRLLEKNSFSDDTTTDDKRTQWIRKTNPIAAFLDDEFEMGCYDWCVTIEDFYNEVIGFCERHEFDKPTSRKYVTEKVLDANLGIKKAQKKIDNVPRTWCWVGLRCTTNTLINHFIGEGQKSKNEQKEL